MLKLPIAAACLYIVGTATVPALAEDQPQPDWMKKLVLSDVFIKSDNDKSSATFTVENHGATMSGRIDVRCTFFDAQDNTVGESWDSIGPIKPGRQGFGRTTSIYYEGATARTSDCHIEEPRNP